ncbi:MAG: hypothetical protein AAGK04_13610 [Planctomycetota bacterium]
MPFCPGCGYDLRGARRDRCPECGGRQTPLVRDLEARETQLRRVFRHTTAFYVVGAPICLGLLSTLTDLVPALLLLLIASVIVTINLSVLGASLVQQQQAKAMLWRWWAVFGVQAAAGMLLVSVTVGLWFMR